MAKAHFGYGEESPTLKKFLLRLLVTDFVHHLKQDTPNSLVQLVLPPQGHSNTVVSMAQWRDSSSRASSYDRLSAEIAALINLDGLLQSCEISDLLDVMTFLGIEQAIASQLRLRVQSTTETLNPEDIRLVATRRQAGHWASPMAIGAAEVPRTALHEVYTALVAAADFFALRNNHVSGFEFADALSLYRAYEDGLHRFDQLYRHFCEAADHAEAQGWNILKPLRKEVEGCYVGWFLPMLGLAWGKFIDPKGHHALLGRAQQLITEFNF